MKVYCILSLSIFVALTNKPPGFVGVRFGCYNGLECSMWRLVVVRVALGMRCRRRQADGEAGAGREGERRAESGVRSASSVERRASSVERRA